MGDDISKQRRNLPLLATKETCSGGTFIVTGANVGLGYEAAKHLVALGSAKVILTVRNLSAGETAKAEIEAATGTTGIAEVWQLDLAKYDSVKAFAKRAVAELDRIDAVIENAGVAGGERAMAEGHLLQITVNVVSTLLLAVLLLPKLSESARRFGILPHLTIVTSNSGFGLGEDWQKIKDDPLVKTDNTEVAMKAYPYSKLIEIPALRHLATILPISRTGVVLNLVNPGVCITQLARNAPPAFRENLRQMHEQFGRTAEDGSRTLLYGAVAGKESHGHLLDSCEIADSKLPSWLRDEEATTSEKVVWEIIARELESIEPGSVKNILKE